MVVGTGIDVVRIDRLREALLRHPQRLPRRLFGPSEIEGGGQVERLAQLFAVKEAASKALGTGFQRGLRWHDFEVRLDPGQTTIVLSGAARRRAAELGVSRLTAAVRAVGGFAVGIVSAEGSRP